MTWWDAAEPIASAFIDDKVGMVDHMLEPLADQVGGIPIVGSAYSGMQSAYHLGSAVYDGVTGDRDGAVDHGVQALYNAAAVVPGVGDVLDPIDAGIGMLGMGARIGAEANGLDSGDIPTGLDDCLSAEAVYLTNAMFGADADAGTGTRQGEIGAGVGAMEMLMAAGTGPVGMGLAYLSGNNLGNAIGSVTSPGEGTSGSDPSWFARQGAAFGTDTDTY